MNTMQPFKASDLLWIEPHAKKSSEETGEDQWANFLRALDTFVMGFVIEPHAVVFVWRDLHGLVGGGFTDTRHLKSMMRIAKFMNDMLLKNGIVAHTHDPTGTIGNKMAERLGWIRDADAYWLKVG